MGYSLKDFGSFFVGGRMVQIKDQPKKEVFRNQDFPKLAIDINGEYVIEQAYVQYFIPDTFKKLLSVVLVHGGGHTGAVWENTPDGRKGWLQFFLKQERAVYVVDNVERGRAGWCSLKEFWQEEPELRSSKGTWEMFRLGLFKDDERRPSFKNQQFPIEFFDELLRYNVPRWSTHQVTSTQSLIQLAEKIGPCIFIIHSQAAAFGIDALKETEAIQGLILIEPASCSNLIDARYKNKQLLFMWGDFIEEFEIWKRIYKLQQIQRKKLEDAQAIVDWIDLPHQGILGNSHLLMMDHNSDALAKIVQNWITNMESFLTKAAG